MMKSPARSPLKRLLLLVMRMKMRSPHQRLLLMMLLKRSPPLRLLMLSRNILNRVLQQPSQLRLRSHQTPRVALHLLQLRKMGLGLLCPRYLLSRVHGSSSSPSEPEETAQRVIAARKRKLRSEGPAETPLPLPVSHKRKSTSPPEKADSYESGMSMPSSDSQASLDLETNVGYDFSPLSY